VKYTALSVFQFLTGIKKKCYFHLAEREKSREFVNKASSHEQAKIWTEPILGT